MEISPYSVLEREFQERVVKGCIPSKDTLEKLCTTQESETLSRPKTNILVNLWPELSNQKLNNLVLLGLNSMLLSRIVQRSDWPRDIELFERDFTTKKGNRAREDKRGFIFV